MKGTTGVIIGVVLAVAIILGVLYYQKQEKNSGLLYIGITDATADINGVTDIDMTVNKVEVHSVEQGWVAVSSGSKVYSLLALKASGETKLYVKGKVPVDSYNKVRVTLGETTVRTKASGDVGAVMPTSYVVMDSVVHVKSRSSAYVELDFLADKSLHVASDGQYIFAPVVKAEYQSNASVAVTGDVVEASDGSVDGTTAVGVDLEGKSRANFQLVTGKSLIVESSTDNEVRFILGGELYTSSRSAPAEIESSTDSKVDIKIPNSIEVGGSLGPKAEINVTSPAVNTEAVGDVKLVQ